MDRGFTLVELLVVITIIVVLLALLTPALDSAVERAERVVCAGNERVFGMAVTNYRFDNNRKIPISPMHYSHAAPFPNVPYVYADTHPGDWSLEMMKAYVSGVGHEDVEGPWVCPSSQAFSQFNGFQSRAERMNQPRGRYLTFDGTWIHSDYAYFAGAQLWRDTHASIGDGGRNLTTTTLTSSRILLTDTFYRHNSGWYWYNHGAYRRTGTPAASGNNKLYGDTSVVWDEAFSPQRNRAIETGTDGMGRYVIGTGNQTSARGETNFY